MRPRRASPAGWETSFEAPRSQPRPQLHHDPGTWPRSHPALTSHLAAMKIGMVRAYASMWARVHGEGEGVPRAPLHHHRATAPQRLPRMGVGGTGECLSEVLVDDLPHGRRDAGVAPPPGNESQGPVEEPARG